MGCRAAGMTRISRSVGGAINREKVTPSASASRDSTVVVDDVVVTGGGVSLAIDATLYLIGKLYGEAARDDVAKLIEYDRAYRANRDELGHRVPDF
jgi:transcriptional regulator GlxA family with amidase domain